MKLAFESYACSATVAKALKEARRQLEAQRTHYAAMCMRGELTGAEAASRMSAQEVVVGIVAEVLAATVAAEGPRAPVAGEAGKGGAE